MSEFNDNINYEDSELDAILSEVRGMELPSDDIFTVDNSEEEAPSKDWSMDDIDRLIADSENDNDIEFGKYGSVLSGEYDTSIFSLQPPKEEREIPELQDVSSGPEEVDGQETFESEFNIDDFELETVVIPEDDKTVSVPKYSGRQEAKEIVAPEIDTVAVSEPEPAEEEPDFSELDSLFGENAADEIAPEINIDEPADEEVNFEEFSTLFGDTSSDKKDEDPKPAEESSELSEKIDESEYRTRFFTKLHLEYTKEEEIVPDGPVDKSGYVVSKTDSVTEGGLDSVPVIMAAEDVKHLDEEKTKIVKEATTVPEPVMPRDTVEGQIILTGFGDAPEDTVPTQSEEDDVEESLWKRRKLKAGTFKLDAIDDEGFGEGFAQIESEEEKYEAPHTGEEVEITEEEEPEAEDTHYGEYTDASQRNAIYNKLASKVKKTKSSFISTGIIALVMMLLEFIPVFCEKLSIETSLFIRESMILCVAKAILLILAVSFDSERFFDSLNGIRKGVFNGNTAVSLALAVALVENTLSAIFGADVAVFSAVAVIGDLLLKATDFIDAKRIFENFSVCAFTYEHNMYAVHRFENDSEIFELGRGLLMGNAEMLYSSNVSFPSDFMKKSKEDVDNSSSAKGAIIIAAAVSFVAGIAALICRGDLLTGISVLTGCFCVGAPVTAAFIPAFILMSANKRLNREGTMISSLESASKAAASNAVVIDSADIFDRERCTMHGMKSFGTLRTDAVLLYASAMVIKSGGPMKECFEKVVDGRQDLLPPVRELVYEDKMGISARIYDQKVLLGNRNMLIHHNIKAPDKAFENKYLHNGHKVIYLACNEMLAALFVVSYSVDEDMRICLKKLESNGIQILVRTNDVNVTEELISDSFGLSRDNFKILSSVAGRLFKRRKDAVSESLPAEIIHDGKASSMIKAIAAACSMTSKSKLTGYMRTALSIIAILAGAIVACAGSMGFTGSVALLLIIIEILITSGVVVLTDNK